MSLPWVVRRSLSPSTEKGRRVLRNTILKKDNKIQWERIMELVEMQKAAAKAAGEDTTSDESSSGGGAVAGTMVVESSSVVEEGKKGPTVPAARTAEEKARKEKEFAAAQQGAMKDAIGTLLGSTSGRALRGVLKDMDTPDLIWKLGSKEGRPILRMGTKKMLSSLFGGSKASNSERTSATTATKITAESNSGSNSASLHGETENYRPISDACLQLREKQAKRSKQITSFLIKRHLRKCLLGFKGIVGITRLVISMLQISILLVLRNNLRRLKTSIRSAPTPN